MIISRILFIYSFHFIKLFQDGKLIEDQMEDEWS
jgi:hypothetical protein